MQGVYCPGDEHWARLEASALGSLCCLPRMEGRKEGGPNGVYEYQCVCMCVCVCVCHAYCMMYASLRKHIQHHTLPH